MKLRKILPLFLVLELVFSNFSFALAQEADSTGSPQVATESATPAPTPFESPSPSPTPLVEDNNSIPAVSDVIGIPEKIEEFAPSAQLKLPISVRALRKKNFRANEKVTIVVENTLSSGTQVKLFDFDGNEAQVELELLSDYDPTVIRITAPAEFKPGRYVLKVTDPEGNVTTQDFTWGVLAINTNKSIYLPNETAKIAIAVLDETGMMVCDAKVKLEIRNPRDEVKTLSTDDESIKVNSGCNLKEMVLTPDFETEYQTSDIGVYSVVLTAETKNGSFSINDAFEVRDNVPFDVERTSATRIYPPEKYPVTLDIKANQDFEGVIAEVVPASFDITALAGVKTYDTVVTKPQSEQNEKVLEASIFTVDLPFKGEYPITQGFGGQHRDPQVSKKYSDFGVVGHDGVDFALPEGTEVLAVDDGTVGRAREDYDYGTTIALEHSWGKSYYGHLSEMKVKEGDKVSKGQVIGLSGSTGLSSAAHLHFGIKPNNNDPDNGYYGKINPLPYLGLDGSGKVLAVQTEDIKDTVTDVVVNNTKGDVKVIAWNVSVKAGENLKLGYKFDAPDESPQFYLLGPLEFRNKEGRVDFQEARQWQIASDLVQPNGRLYYGDQTNTALRFQTNTFDFTFNGELSFTHGASASLIAHTVAKAAPTRDEIMVGNLKVDGQLMVIKGINGYDVAGDYSLAWTNTGTTPAQTCNSTTEVDCTRAFDITYERLSGRAMVVYADNVNQKLYYCYWNGSVWAPQSACTPTNGTNDITLTSNGRPDYVSLKAKGGSNEILLGVSIDVAGTHEVETFIWDGSAWGTNDLATSSTDASVNTLELGNVFDIEWESNSGDAMVVWGTTSAGSTLYKLKPSGASWGSDQTGPALVGGDGVINTLNLDADPASNRIAFASTDSANDGNLSIWKADGLTAGWTMGNEDITLNNDNPGMQLADVLWQKSGSVAMWFAQTGLNAADIEYQTATCDGTGCTFSAIDATIPTAGIDDPTFVRLATSPNSNDIMALWSHIDRDVYAQHWDGSAWEAAASVSLEADISPGTADSTFYGAPLSVAFVYIPYTPWSRNWKFWQGTDTTNTPTNQLAAENTAPTGFTPETGKFRLRFSVIELSGMGQTDARKKLQYTSGASCTPNTVEGDTDCTWVDVDDPAGAGQWRYVDCNSGDGTICDDNQTLSATTLSGTPTAGWWVQDKDAAGGTAMDHNALQLRELEYSVEANNAAGSTTYYFRMYDVDQNKAVRREQDNDGANDCATATCTYPSLTTSTASGPTTDQQMRHGKWFNAGAEQPFTF